MLIILVAFAGIWLVLAPDQIEPGWASLWGLCSGMSAAVAIIYLNVSRHHHDSQTILLFMFGLGAAQVLVTGVVLEDEKAGFHWAFGRSDHLGGVVGVDEFESPDTVVHQDIVYAAGNPIQVEQADIIHADGRRISIIVDGEYMV